MFRSLSPGDGTQSRVPFRGLDFQILLSDDSLYGDAAQDLLVGWVALIRTKCILLHVGEKDKKGHNE